MTYSIIPPILVVLSVIGIILFLMKKASQIVEVSEKEKLGRGQREEESKPGILRKPFFRKEKTDEVGFRHRFLLFLEKITRRVRLVFLKLDNLFKSWSERIRQKRNIEKKERMEEATDEQNQMRGNYNLPEREGGNFERSDKREKINVFDEEKTYRPMISDRVVSPKIIRGAETKDRLEKLLIERIAANPKDTEAYERLGEYYFEVANYDYAKECFKQVIKLDPTNAEARSKMRKLGRLLGR
ncbi:MAG TPA: tetratricopeptide repeat protein [Candidatus Moranbacteria bacterium]|nr:tetratricopeptide repeat protein [Candidatus Moranbacteria bacterium]